MQPTGGAGLESGAIQIAIKVNIQLKPARVMLPNRCSIKQGGRQCPNPPEFIVSITSDDGGEYMLGVTCSRHKQDVLREIQRLQDDGKVTRGTIGFASVKSVGTDCIRADPDELVQIDMQRGREREPDGPR